MQKKVDVFPRDKGRPDGLYPQCKECRNIYGRLYRQKKHGRRIAYERKWSEQRKERETRVCSVADCGNRWDYGVLGGLCNKHYLRYRKYGNPETLVSAKGNGYVDANGYRVIQRTNDPFARADGAVLEHRYVMSTMLQRPLLPEETVHHRNRNKLDNRPENLELWSGRHMKGSRVAEMLEWAREIIALYGNTAVDPKTRPSKNRRSD